jgi:tetratricopeptide (TPR) repeat protein
MFTDMVGYSSLTQEDETLAIELLEEHRKILREILPRFGGREIDTAGDAFFVEFSSALGATECAIEIQTTLHERNEANPGRRPIVIRIGLHLGDVMHSGDQVLGDGVNIAARMEPLARPGSICISEDVARQVANKIKLPLVPLGEQQLKNIRLQMRVFHVVMPWEEEVVEPSTSSIEKTHVPKALSDAAPTPSGWKKVALPVIGILVALSLFIGVLSIQWQTDEPAVVSESSLGAVDQANGVPFDPGSGRDVAGRLGAGSFILGNVVEIGGQLQIDAGLYQGDAPSPIMKATVEGSTDEIFRLVDGLAGQLLIIDRTGPGAPIDRLEALTTESFDALKHYLHGVSAFRAARFQEAADELTLAVQEDSTFALAWYQLSSTAEWLFDPDLAIESARKASRYKDRLPDRGQRLVEALYAGKIGSNREALRLYRDFLTSYPDDVEAWYQLSELEFHTGPLLGVRPAESSRAWERLLFYEPDQITALIHSARIHVSEGNWDQVRDMAARVIALEPAAERNIELMTHLALREPGDAPDDELANLLSRADDDMLMDVIWSLGSFRDSPTYAAKMIPFMTDPSRPREVQAMGHVIRAYLDIGLGRLESASKAFAEADGLDYGLARIFKSSLFVLPFRSVSMTQLESAISELNQWDPADATNSTIGRAWFGSHDGIHAHLRQYMLGLLNARAGNLQAASQSVRWLDESSTPPQFGSLTIDFARAVAAEIAIQQGDTTLALQELGRAERRIWYQFSLTSPLSSHGRERFLGGVLLGAVGRPQQAIETLGHLRDYSLFDWAYAAPAHLESARMAERLDQTELARSHYERFVALWKDADDELHPQVEYARERLALLLTE